MSTIKLWFVGVLVCMVAGWSHAANEVVPIKSVSTVGTRYGFRWQNVRIEARVANLAYHKQVYVRMKRWDGQWMDVALVYRRPGGAGYEIWSTADGSTAIDPPTNTTYNPEFVLKYVANGVTYWANNDGANYKQGSDTGSVLYGRNVYAGSSYAASVPSRNGIVSGVLTTRSLGSPDSIAVVYSTDDWATTRTASATSPFWYWYGAYSGASNPNVYGFKEWIYELNIGAATSFQYAVKYTFNGQTYWDNNFGNNYFSKVVPG